MAAPSSDPADVSAAEASRARSQQSSGLLYALAAFLLWGLSPIYFKALKEVPPLEIAAHRVVWAIGFLAVLLGLMGRLRTLRSGRPTLRRLGLYLATTVLIGGNWLLYIWAVNTGHLLEASLGYFINPLVNVLLGVLFLRETLNRRQLIAVLLAAAGVLYQVVGYGRLPVISLVLATSFGLYGLLRKKGQVDPIAGLLIETSLLTPAALIYLVVLASTGAGAFVSGGLRPTLLLGLAGAVTAIPLVWFQLGANRLRLSTIGLLQYISPVAQFLLAVLIYDERFTSAHAITFAFIWASLTLYTWDALSQQRRLALVRSSAPARG